MKNRNSTSEEVLDYNEVCDIVEKQLIAIAYELFQVLWRMKALYLQNITVTRDHRPG
jgi:hypothetical protein